MEEGNGDPLCVFDNKDEAQKTLRRMSERMHSLVLKSASFNKEPAWNSEFRVYEDDCLREILRRRYDPLLDGMMG